MVLHAAADTASRHQSEHLFGRIHCAHILKGVAAGSCQCGSARHVHVWRHQQLSRPDRVCGQGSCVWGICGAPRVQTIQGLIWVRLPPECSTHVHALHIVLGPALMGLHLTHAACMTGHLGFGQGCIMWDVRLFVSLLHSSAEANLGWLLLPARLSPGFFGCIPGRPAQLHKHICCWLPMQQPGAW